MSTSAPTVLERIVHSTRQELERRKHKLPPERLAELAAERSPKESAAGGLSGALERPGIAVIAEFKRRSPSAGLLCEGAEVAQIVGAYERGGASALSVLTEGPNFHGSLDDLRAARAASRLPILRKDFIIDPYQLDEAVLAGADAVLLIVAALTPEQLLRLHRAAVALGLEVLVEVHDRAELDSALELGAAIIGVNNRDLRDLSVDVTRTARLLPVIPAGVVVVSESGIASAEQLAQLEQHGVHAVLVGESLMRAPDPELALTALLAGSRAGS